MRYHLEHRCRGPQKGPAARHRVRWPLSEGRNRRGGARVASLEETIKKDWKTYTPAEQKLATYFLA
ncbi:MAG TPA: hypothetical protein VGG92_22730, partial [Caulobacteraceae bacterium]